MPTFSRWSCWIQKSLNQCHAFKNLARKFATRKGNLLISLTNHGWKKIFSFWFNIFHQFQKKLLESSLHFGVVWHIKLQVVCKKVVNYEFFFTLEKNFGTPNLRLFNKWVLETFLGELCYKTPQKNNKWVLETFLGELCYKTPQKNNNGLLETFLKELCYKILQKIVDSQLFWA